MGKKKQKAETGEQPAGNAGEEQPETGNGAEKPETGNLKAAGGGR